MDVLAFWAAALLTGALALPIAFTLLRRLPDAGSGMAFPLGLLLVGYGYFILRSLSVLPAGRGGYLLALVLLGLVSAVVAGRDRRFGSTLSRALSPIFLTVGLFSLAFFGYAGFRSYQPDIEGTEQPMDFMYLNATVNSPDYPPHDSWLAGENASYYYFGYLQVGVLTEVAGIEPSTGYNMGLAYTFAAAAAAIASLAYALARWVVGARGVRWALFAAGTAVVLLLFVGSLAALFEWAAAHGDANQSLFGLFDMKWRISCALDNHELCYQGAAGTRTAAWYPTEFFFWFSLTRVIPNTITEFPFFSFLLGDLHPHVMSIPLVLLSLGLSATAWRGRGALSLVTHRRLPLTGVLLALVFGGLAFENAWDLLTFSALFLVVVVVRNLRAARGWRAVSLATAGYLLPLAVVAVVAYLPWYLDFSSQADGFFPYIGQGTKPSHAFLQFGPLLLAALAGLSWAFRRGDRRYFGNAALGSLWVPLVPLMGWVLLASARGELRDAMDARTGAGWVTLVAYGVTAWLMATAFAVNAAARRVAALPFLLAAFGALLFFGAELFYIGDIFTAVPRLNTVFKLTYQAWTLLSAAGAVTLVLAARAALRERRLAAWAWAPVALVCVLGLTYALISLPNRTDGFDKETATDGLAFLARNDPDEYALTRWVEQNVPPGEVIIEASGRTWTRNAQGEPEMVNPGVDYSDASRISERTGRQTVIGWYFHEIQWRGDTPANQAEFVARQDLLDAVYTADSPDTALEAMDRAGSDYVVVGRLELSRFPGDLMPKFDTFLDVAFDSNGLRIYRRPSYEVLPTS